MVNPSSIVSVFAALLAASAAAPPALGQTRTAGSVVVSPKIDPRVRERAQSETAIPVFIVLDHQPQREIFARARAANALYGQVAESRYRQAAERALSNGEEVRQAREAADAVVLRTRQQAFQAIEQAVVPEQEALEGRLRGLGATRVAVPGDQHAGGRDPGLGAPSARGGPVGRAGVCSGEVCCPVR